MLKLIIFFFGVSAGFIGSLVMVANEDIDASTSEIYVVLQNNKPVAIESHSLLINMTSEATPPSSESQFMPDGVHVEKFIEGKTKVTYEIKHSGKISKVTHFNGVSSNIEIGNYILQPGRYVIGEDFSILAVALHIKEKNAKTKNGTDALLRRQMANEAFEKGNALEAAALLEGSIDPNPALQSRDLLLSGRSYALLGFWWVAEQKAESAYSLDEDFLEALYNIACYRNRNGSPSNALASLDLLAKKLTKKPEKIRKRYYDLAMIDKDLADLRDNLAFKKFLERLRNKS